MAVNMSMRLVDRLLSLLWFSRFAQSATKSGYPGTGLAGVKLMGIYDTDYYIQSRQATSVNWTSNDLMCTASIAKGKVMPLDDLLPAGPEAKQLQIYYSCSSWYYCCEFECCKYRMGMAASGLVILFCFLFCAFVFGIHNCCTTKRPMEESVVVGTINKKSEDFESPQDQSYHDDFKSAYQDSTNQQRHIHFQSYDNSKGYPTNV